MTLITKDVPNSLGIPLAQGKLKDHAKRRQFVAAVRFTLIDDGDYDVIYRSNKQNNTEFDYWMVIKLMYMEQYLSEDECTHKYHCQIHIVAPSQVPQEEKNSCLGSMGIEDWQPKTEEEWCMLLVEYGTSACVWQQDGNNKNELIRAAKLEAQAVEMLFGFYMDVPRNGFGATGWDFLTGDLMAGLNRYKEEQV